MPAHHEDDGKPCLRKSLSDSSEKSIHLIMKFGDDFWWRGTLTWIWCEVCSSTIQNNQESNGLISNLWSSHDPKKISPNSSDLSPLARGLSGLGLIELRQFRSTTHRYDMAVTFLCILFSLLVWQVRHYVWTLLWPLVSWFSSTA